MPGRTQQKISDIRGEKSKAGNLFFTAQNSFSTTFYIKIKLNHTAL